MQVETWRDGEPPADQLGRLITAAARPGLLLVVFEQAAGPSIVWRSLAPWTRSRAVTVAEVRSALAGGALEAALSCDLVYVSSGALLELPPAHETPSAGLLHAAGRAGRRALARLLLAPGPVTPSEALELGLADGVLQPGERAPLPERPSLAALTAARDLVRARGRGTTGAALELASFRFVVATGDPAEGASAFLERREPEF